MELNTHACLLRGRSGKVTAIKRLDLEVYKLEEGKSNGGKKEKNNFFDKIKGPVGSTFLEKESRKQWLQQIHLTPCVMSDYMPRHKMAAS